MKRPRIGITLGDPGGIGPEIIVKSLSSGKELPHCDYTLYGAVNIVQDQCRRMNTACDDLPIKFPAQMADFSLTASGRAAAENGKISFQWFQQAAEDAAAGKLDALVTAPISKLSWDMAGLDYAGHTDYFNRNYPHAIMSFFSPRLNIALYSHHLPLKTALANIKQKPLLDFYRHLHQYLNHSPEKRFSFLAAGMNPHAGEAGQIGTEEIYEIIPAIQQAQAEGIPITGPFPPDTICRSALDQPDKMIASLYHDQGLIGFKLISFEEGVNTTLGLPYYRTAPDHGTAYDIYGQGRADPRSMLAAIKLAHDLAAGTSREHKTKE